MVVIPTQNVSVHSTQEQREMEIGLILAQFFPKSSITSQVTKSLPMAASTPGTNYPRRDRTSTVLTITHGFYILVCMEVST